MKAANPDTKSRKGAWRSRLRRMGVKALIAAIVMWMAAEAALRWVFPFPMELIEDARRRGNSTVVCDRRGAPLRAFLGRDDSWLIWRSIHNISPRLLQATIAVEDERFYLHPGVDPVAVARACLSNVRRCRVVSGASTITMQLMRLLRPRPRRLSAKIVESFRAIQVERLMDKREILELYLNLAPYGGNLIGVQAASLRYFGKNADDLTLAEAALLAGLPKSPSRLRPDRRPARAKLRRDHALRRMLGQGFISAAECLRALAEPINVTTAPAFPFKAPHVTQMALGLRPGLAELRTTLDPQVQGICETALRRGVARLRPEVTNGAGVVIENRAAAVRALVGSCDFLSVDDQGQVNGATAPRSPGSTLKPVVYALAFEQGVAAPDTILADTPCGFTGYEPRNYDRSLRGPVTGRDALVESLNVPAVRLLNRVGVKVAFRAFKRLGFASLKRSADHYGLALTLGSAEVTLLELTNAYAALARLGVYRPCRLLETGSAAPAARVISEPAAWLVADILSDTGRLPEEASWKLERGRRVAWKTGTSYGHRDAWTVAYTPEYTVGVWVGNFSGRAAGALVGLRAAAPIALDIMGRLSRCREMTWFKRPAAVETRVLCSVSGMTPGPHCKTFRRGLRIRGVSPSQACPVHTAVAIDAETGARLCPLCRKGRKHRVEVREVWPAGIAAWLREREPGRDLAPPHFTGCPRALDTCVGPRILSPVAGQTYLAVQDSPAGGPKLLLKAVATAGRLFWFVDGALFASADPSQPTAWPLRRGVHKVVCSDPAGRSSSVVFKVE